jgi:hypothetical protein
MSIITLREEIQREIKHASDVRRYKKLPVDVQLIIQEYLQEVINSVRKSINNQFFLEYAKENAHRMLKIMESWSKRQLGIVLNGILVTNTTHDKSYPRSWNLQCYLEYDSWLYQVSKVDQMRLDVLTYIGHRNSLPEGDPMLALTGHRRYNGHLYTFLKFNGVTIKEEERSPIRVYGAYKAIEEYNFKIQSKKQICRKK